MSEPSGTTDLLFCHRVAGEADAQFLEDFLVHFAEHYSAMYLTTFELR